MNSWNPNNNLQQPQFNPYNWNQRLPVYNAAPIQGENAAWQFPMGANSEIYLPDSEEDIIWWIRTDSNGNRSVQAFDVTPHKKPEPVNMEDLAARLSVVEEWINAKSNKSNAKRPAANATNTTSATTVESVN